MRILLGIMIFSAVLVFCLVFFMYLGIYNISALQPHSSLARWFLSTTMDNSVRRHAAAVTVPPLDDENLVRTGAGIYHKCCVLCHGAAGIDRSEIGKGLYPLPPKLAETAGDWTPAEAFWIIKNGVKMSGMPAFSRSMDDNRLWAVTAFIQRLPRLSPQQYRDLGNPR